MLVILPSHYEKSFNSPTHGVSTGNSVLIGPVVSEMFKNVDDGDDADDDGRLSIV